MIETIKSLFTAEQLHAITEWFVKVGLALIDDALGVALIIFLTFSVTQIFKIITRRARSVPNPADWVIHLFSASAACVWGYLLFDQRGIDERFALASVAWGITFLAVTYGGGFIREYYPRLWGVINLERRRVDAGPPIGVDVERRNR